MHWSKLVLCAVSGGSIAFIIGGLSLNIFNTKFTVVAEPVVTQAPEDIDLPPATASLSAVLAPSGSYPTDDWLSLPPDTGAIVLFVPLVASDRAVVLRNETGKILDSIEARSGLPLLRQYRIEPGTYEVHLEGFADVAINVKPGKIATIQISQTRIGVTRGPPEQWGAIQASRKPFGCGIAPQLISSAERILYFSAERAGQQSQAP